jgi:hypothetical protein
LRHKKGIVVVPGAQQEGVALAQDLIAGEHPEDVERLTMTITNYILGYGATSIRLHTNVFHQYIRSLQ